MRGSESRLFSWLCIIVVTLLLGMIGVYAQTTANIVGKVLDPSAAVIPGVRVVAINLDTGFQREAVSSDSGTYEIPLLPLGTYRVEAELVGFKKFVQTGIVLTVGQNARVDPVLQVGEVAETVTVEANARQVETRKSSISRLMDQKRVEQLPLQGRDPLRLINLLPGASRVSVPEQGTRDVSVNISGGNRMMNSFSLDGAQANMVQRNQGLPMPPPDMVKEFRAETNSYDASRGRGSVATFEVVTRAGTNAFHGSAFAFHRNGALNARNFFQGEAPFLVYNQFGGTIGGPIVKDRTHFFFGYQGTRIREANVFASAFPPTSLERQGDFSQSAQPPIDPTTGEPFPDGIIPTERMDPAALTILNSVPLPNSPDGKWVSQESGGSDVDQVLGRVDHQVSSANQFTFRFWRDGSERFGVLGNIPGWTTDLRPYTVYNATVRNTHTFGPGLINDAQLSYGRRDESRFHTNKSCPADFGIQGIPTEECFPPDLNVFGRFSLSTSFLGNHVRLDNTWQVRDTILWNKGDHSFKFGFSWERLSMVGRPNFDQGLFQFNGELTGNELADFMLGHVSRLQLLYEREDHYSWFLNFFVQDDYQISENVTLNLGLRYQYDDPVIQLSNNLATFKFEDPSFQSTRFPNSPPGMAYAGGGSNNQFAGDAGIPRATFFPDKNNFGPRIGISWDIFGDARTSLRVGWGLFYQINTNGYSQGAGLNQPFLPQFILLSDALGPLSDPFRDNPLPSVVPGVVSTHDPQTDEAQFVLPASPWAIERNIRNPYIQHYSVSIQHQLPKDFMVEVSYVGNTARKLATSVDRNPADCPTGSVDDCTLANRQARRRFGPDYGRILAFEDGGISHYNSLQLLVRKRFTDNYLLNFNYTWSRWIDTVTGYNLSNVHQDPDNPGLDKSLSNFDRRHILSASWVWDLPYLRQHGSPIVRNVIGGWELTGLVSATSGIPVEILSGVDNSRTGLNHDRPNLIGNPELDSGRPRGQLIAEYFNTSAFEANAPLTFGNAGRNTVIGPGFFNVDFGLIKNFPFGESQNVQFRSEFFNLFNRPNFGNPQNRLSSGSFGQILSALEARRIQFALKYTF